MQIKKTKLIKAVLVRKAVKLKLNNHPIQGKSAFIKSVLDRILLLDGNISIERVETPPQSEAFRYAVDIKKEYPNNFSIVLRNSLLCLSEKICEIVLKSIDRYNWDSVILLEVVQLLVKNVQKQSRLRCCSLYADLCREILLKGGTIPHENIPRASRTSKGDRDDCNHRPAPIATKGDLFRKLLVGGLVLEFQSKGNRSLSEDVYAKKSSYVGLVQFLGALYSKGVDDGRLPDIIRECCLKVLSNASDEYLLDCLSQLLLSVGCKLEQHFQQAAAAAAAAAASGRLSVRWNNAIILCRAGASLGNSPKQQSIQELDRPPHRSATNQRLGHFPPY